MKLLNSLKDEVLNFLSSLPEKEEFISRDSLKYWLRRERQDRMDMKGLVD